ncbi:hypothetical protein R50345_24415 [Paenibacillus sp. FSL R5-0345]|uniref:NAD-dependent epimerase/dehydratase family protein n=1 Tax=Paenibacillus sp. FSL R5-0345 TaxID=1536770 RepID=UPI0004F6F5CA|nr:NAD-dependent epimerase/dehydratase family protein [Paenibacillus sp. FSL R5-0345]AIQ37496.1 hypothetical protein R50345_24415 [Paenibacillus sp. FSL R5-0345]
MKILITGEKSYIGKKFGLWLSQWPEDYEIDFIPVRDEKWREKDFSQFDVLFHVAALVHRKEKSSMHDLYYTINKELTIELSKKAKKDGVKQFVFLSTMAVYGLEGSMKKNIVINKNTKENPNTLYGETKLQAEKELLKMEDNDYIISIIRPPMIYGPNCPGNFKKLKRLVLASPIFPKIRSKRSMLYIDNLSDFIRVLINKKKSGVFHPQNPEYIDIQEMIKAIALNNNKKIYLSEILAKMILLLPSLKIANKLFGSLVYDFELTDTEIITTSDFLDTIKKSN